MILEVDISNRRSLGASGHVGDRTGDGSSPAGIGFGGVQLPELSSLNPASALAAGGLLGGVFGATLTGLGALFGSAGAGEQPVGATIPSYGLLFQALATQSNTNVLSAPSIIAIDNEEAKSKIGENVPYLSSVVPATAGAPASALVTSVARQPLELELSIKPHISANDTILLEIKHSAGGIKATGDTTLGPTWTTRSVETRVVVRDQQTVLIGGLMQNTDEAVESKVPLLGDVPLLGYLFKYRRNTRRKSNLLIMLTPYIIKDQLALQDIQQRKLRQSEEFFRSFASLSRMAFEPAVDYRRKRGLIEEINRAVQDVEADAAGRAAIAAPPPVPAGRVEVPSAPADGPADPLPAAGQVTP